MENNQRFWLFMVLAMGIWLGWIAWFGPKPKPQPKNKKPAAAQNVAEAPGKQPNKANPEDPDAEQPGADKTGADKTVPTVSSVEPGDAEKPAVAEAQPVEEPAGKLPVFPHQVVEIGSRDPEGDYRLLARLDSRGAVVDQVDLVEWDPKRDGFLYSDLRDRKIPQTVVGSSNGKDLDTVRKERLKHDQIVLSVQSIFSRRCHKCHAGVKPENGFRINTREGLLAGGDSGPAIKVGDPEGSLLVAAIRREDKNFQMPPEDPLPAEEINQIVRWIELDAPTLSPVTLQTQIPAIEGQFAEHGVSLSTVDWELTSDPKDKSQAVFRITSPDGQTVITKTYRLQKAAGENGENESDAYVLGFQLSIENKSKKAQTVNYLLQGPVGVPLENVKNATVFRSVKFAYLDEEDEKFNADSLAAADIAEGEISKWAQPVLKYIGVDVQYFAAFLQPHETQTVDNSYFDSYTQVVVERDEAKPQWSDVSVVLTSRMFEVAPGQTLKHDYNFFAGPKQADLLAPRDADSIRDLGFFSAIAKIMLVLLGFFYSVIPNYGIAIMMLTVLVRMSMFPLSRKQALGAAKMQEIKPEIDALKKKYGDDREKMGRAQMELFRKHKYNPFSGCLVLFVQMPIFFALYQSLRSSVDLRMAPFLWIDNLAAPDALFKLGFELPWLKWDQFNLLPIITIGLFILQQKLFMPPATDEQSAMQQKMMGYMMIFMGFMFYQVPAGLCVYFISSSLWGIAERMLLPKVQKKREEEEAADGGGKGGGNGIGPKSPPKKGAPARRKSRPGR